MAETIFEKHLKPGGRVFALLALVWIISLFLPVKSQSGDNPVKVKVPETIHVGLLHFLDLVDPDKKVSFDPKMVARVLDFIEGPKEESVLYFGDRVLGLPSAYYEFDVRKGLSDIVAYSFNPDIPLIATMPSSTRLFQWRDERGKRSAAPQIGRFMEDFISPVVIKGLQFVENTPDTNSGAYYAYNLYQTTILFNYRGRNVLVTISRQADVSSVGKKGYVLGADDDWDYYYSGKNGLTLPALGWVRSYMYDSSAVIIYDEIDKTAPKVRCAMFKWLRAGWSGINMVKNEHIYYGLKRYAKPLKEIMESPLLPPVEALASAFNHIRGFSDNTLRSKMKIYADILKNRYNGGHPLSRKLYTKLFADEKHWQRMSKDQMQSALVVEYMKSVVGKTDTEETDELFAF